MVRFTRSKKLLVAGVTLALIGGGVALAASSSTSSSPAAGASVASNRPGFPGGPGGRRPLLRRLSSAEVHVVYDGQPHTIRIDKGQIQSVSSNSVTLKEEDGSVVQIPIGADTRVFLDREDAALTDLRTGDMAFAVRIDDNPARAVRAFDAGGFEDAVSPTQAPSASSPA
jgi:hypothetical protein